MENMERLRELALYAARGTAPANFTEGDVNVAFAGEISKYMTSLNMFMKNRYDIYEIIIQTIDDIVPKQVITALSPFAEFKTVPQGQKALFKRKLGVNRAKGFLTQVGLSGVYETFRLDNETFEVNAHAIGGGARVDFERLADGADSLTELMQIVTAGLEDSVYLEVQKALKAAYNATTRPAANKVSVSSFDGAQMLALINVVKAYGQSCAIFAPPEFIAAMGPDAIVPAISGAQGIYSPQDIEAIHDRGKINIFRGTPIVEIPQSFIDENNNKTWIDPQYAYVLPTGGEKVVKVAFEGPTFMYDAQNRDQSMEIYTYKKLGVAIMSHHNWGIYKNTGITDTVGSLFTGMN